MLIKHTDVHKLEPNEMWLYEPTFMINGQFKIIYAVISFTQRARNLMPDYSNFYTKIPKSLHRALAVTI